MGNKRKIPVYLLLLAGGSFMVFPFLWMIATSFKKGADVFNLSLWPSRPTLANYAALLAKGVFPVWFFNSILVGLLTTASILFFDSLAGFALCKYAFRGRKAVFLLILSTMMIPTEMLVIPWYIMSKNLRWADTYWGIMFPGMMSGFGTFLMKQFFDTVPNELLEVGRLDGLNEFQIWRRIAMPLVTAAISALAIFNFIGNWNAFLWPLIVTSKVRLFTLPVGLAFFSGEFQTEWEMVMTGATVATLPVLILFVFFQRQIIQGVALTGLKG